MLRTIGDDLLARDPDGRFSCRIATVFPRTQTVVTLPGIHATQRLAYVEWLNGQLETTGQPPLTEQQENTEFDLAVDLILDEDSILIRPNPAAMELAFEADEVLQQVVSKKKIKFLHLLHPQVRAAIERHGERWRISPLPRSSEEMRKMIAGSRIGIGGRDIYYYNKSTGTRILTFQEFSGLASLPDKELLRYLDEVGQNCSCCNRMGCPEVDFFMSTNPELKLLASKAAMDAGNSMPVRTAYETLRQQFKDAVPTEFQHDDLHTPQWRSQMYAALIGHTDKEVTEEALLGLSAEFFMQVEWLPGGRIEEGEMILDPVFEEEAASNNSPLHQITDDRARGFIFNFIRDYGDLEYVNIGRVVQSLSTREKTAGRRGVYLAEVKLSGSALPMLRIIRMQKFGVSEHLDEGRDLLRAMLQSDEYTEYILDRRLGCRQLGMNLSSRTTARKVAEPYLGPNRQYQGQYIRSPYFERDYVPGLATDKIAAGRFSNDSFAIRFARLLGRAAAANLIVGRSDLQGKVIFDDGDELVIEDAAGLPIDMIVADHTGTFGDYQGDFRPLLPAYAESINERSRWVPNPAAFANAYLDGFLERFTYIQREYRKRRRAFDTLFKHLERDEAGSFSFRWERVLKRLDAADPVQLTQTIRAKLV